MNEVAAGLAFVGFVTFVAASILFYRRLFSVSPGWGVAGIVFPPAGLIAFVTYYRKHPMAALAIVSGLYLFVVCTLLWGRMNPQHAMLEQFPQLRQWLVPAAMGVPRYEYAFPQLEEVPAGQLQAVLNGKVQHVLNVEWVGNTLRFSNSDPLNQVSLQIRFTEGWQQGGQSRHIFIAPTQTDVPEVELFSTNASHPGEPEIVVLKHGYWLQLDIDDSHPRLISGTLKLMLPNHYHTWVAGTFAAHTESVRYVNGELDRQHDSKETLERIAVSHVNSYLWKWLKAVPVTQQLFYQTSYDPLDGTAVVSANLGALGQFDIPVEFRKGDAGWFVVPDAAPVLAMNIEMQLAPTAAGASNATSAATRSEVAAKTVARFALLGRHLGESGVVYTIDGRKLAGTLAKVEGQQLKLRRDLGPNTLGNGQLGNSQSGSNQLTVTVSAHNFVKFVPVQ